MAVERVKLDAVFQILCQGPCPQRAHQITHLKYFHLVIKQLMLTNRYKQIYGTKLLIHATRFL